MTVSRASSPPWLESRIALVERLAELLAAHQEIVVFGHKDADGDTLGCCLAFSEALRAQGKEVQVVVPPPWSNLYRWMPGFERIGDQLRSDLPQPSLALFLDVGGLERAGPVAEQLLNQVTTINIDHHASNSHFGDLNLIYAEASAVGQMCLHLLQHFGWEITPDMATNLYTAIMTDTGGFRHDNTSATTLADASRLAELGAEPSLVAAMIYKSRPLTTIKLSGLCLSELEVEMEGRLAWARVTKQMLRTARATMAESEGIIDTMSSIKGLEVAIMFKEIESELTKISVRSRQFVDAAALCARFGGGGHIRAAGAEVKLSMSAATAAVSQAAREVIAHASCRS
ncbi:MAG: DHH family phosphoesterase [Candidatus Dormibacteraceae bacterium]